MKKRILENWLANVNERTYQPIFIQALRNKGYTIKHDTRHSPIELGKDTIALDKDGNAFAFQLKGANGKRLTLKEYQREIHYQLQTLATGSLKRYGIKGHYHSVFVINGEVDEEARLAIVDFNDSLQDIYKGKRSIEIWSFGKLFEMIDALGGSLWSDELNGSKLLLKYLLDDGKGEYDIEKLETFLIKAFELLEKSSQKSNKNEFIRNIYSSTLFVSISLTYYYEAKNYYSILTTWTYYQLFLVTLKNKFTNKDYKKHIDKSLVLISSHIKITLNELILEILNKGKYLEEGDSQTEFVIYKYRFTILLGVMSAYYCLNKGSSEYKETLIRVKDFIISNYDKFYLFSERACSSSLSIFWSLILMNKKKLAKDFLYKITKEILQKKLSSGDQFLADPQIKLEEVIKHEVGTLIEFIDSPLLKFDFSKSSYVSKIFFFLLAKYNCKKYCKELWSNYSRIRFKFTRFLKPWHWCLLKGAIEVKNYSEEPPISMTWSTLQAIADSFNEDNIVADLKDNPELSLLSTLLLPDKINLDLTMFLDDKLVQTK